jgi:Spy/CpxP family protein refolding chaperone
LKKITIHLISLAAITAGLFLTPAVAQQGRPDPAQMVQMRVDRMNEELKLSKAQQKQITGIYTDAMTANETVQGGMRTAREALVAAIKSNDTAAMSQAANTIGTLTAQTTVTNAKAEAAVYAALTPDQQAKFQPSAGMGGYGGGQGGGRRRGGPPQQ